MPLTREKIPAVPVEPITVERNLLDRAPSSVEKVDDANPVKADAEVAPAEILLQEAIDSDEAPPDSKEQSFHDLGMQIIKTFSHCHEAESISRMSEAEAREFVKTQLESLLMKKLESESATMTSARRADLVHWMMDEILDFGPITSLLSDPAVSEVMVNGPRQIFVERAGHLERSNIRFYDADHLMQIVCRIANRMGRQIDLAHPYVDARLPDGSRVHVIIPPVSLDGASVTIRKFKKESLHVEDMITSGAMTRVMADFLRDCVRARLNIVVAGGTSTGKTTLLNLLSSLIQPAQRIVTIEDAAELKVKENYPHVVRLETRTATSSSASTGISIRDLVKCSLRMRPDRIIIGECRGGETLDMLQAMNTGHDGSMSTAHANSARELLQRMETMCLMAGVEIPAVAIRRQIASAVNLIVHLKRFADGSRRISEITEVEGFREGEIVLRQLFWFEPFGRDETGRIIGEFKTTNIPPSFVFKFDQEGIPFPYQLFRRRKSSSLNPDSPLVATRSVPSFDAERQALIARQVFSANPDRLSYVSAWIMGVLSGWSFPAERVLETEAVLANAVSGILLSLAAQDTTYTLDTEIRATPESFDITLNYPGTAFDPVALGAAGSLAGTPQQEPAESEDEPGVGRIDEASAPARSAIDYVSYDFSNGLNRFTMKFLREESPG